MNDLLLEFQSKINKVNTAFQRYLYYKIDLNNRLIAIKGARGVGKTTLLLQMAKNKLPIEKTLYVSLEHIYFYQNNLYELAKEFQLYGGKYLLLDEVHKYPNWSREIKLIYDNLDDLNIIFTSSSVLELNKSESDLSRRMVSYYLNELSFREFVYFEKKITISPIDFDDVIFKHNEIATEILKSIKPIPLFVKYLEKGAYPYYIENEEHYLDKLLNTLDLVIHTDIPTVNNINFEHQVKLKQLLKVIASSAPFVPNISKLSQYLGVSRNLVVEFIKILESAGLIIALHKENSGLGVLTKPDKLYLNNTNLMFALDKTNVNKGNLRETFFAHQLLAMQTLNLSKQVDFLVNNTYHFEVGGKHKSQKQLVGMENAFIVKDDIEIGVKNIIPIWLFGFLY
jgi:uncharacterized protein